MTRRVRLHRSLVIGGGFRTFCKATTYDRYAKDFRRRDDLLLPLLTAGLAAKAAMSLYDHLGMECELFLELRIGRHIL